MSTGVVIAIALAIAVLVLVIVGLSRRRAPDDHVEAFRRQIDALSPEARRPTIGKMNPPETPPADDDGADAP